ncbi:winged helix-turn-helix domain-containing protein [Flagellimonas algicola]|uniref:Winged helix-turn-helix transcriptional regulator n=1 Tax=Flagellimonas algicola TaxID=2583815 RepID=A0ABY2WJG1_9FLAO|nr:winged helix-turn-helix domain-containing protein [Allomuricauda algicola]TMU54984.1 winged helix-turn-helix transcriptional regulator [Allomuricauda algicola]
MKVVLYIYSALFVFALSFSVIKKAPKGQDETFSNRVKIALRNTGNTLLLQSRDSSSLVLPVVQNGPQSFQLTFEMELPIVPDSLVASVARNFKAMNLPSDYLVEVVDCQQHEVNYSYAISDNEERNIVPCLGRNLPKNCYSINVIFPKPTDAKESKLSAPWYTLAVFGTLGIGLFFLVKRKDANGSQDVLSYIPIGNYAFYKDQNKLVKDGVDIKLTAKETDLLKIFAENINQVVSRDQLLKDVWENKGVFVGRSLDTFISKLRKKFKDEVHINLINVHGVGYKLEILK